MARPTTDSADTDSLKENVATYRVKAEKVKEEGARAGKQRRTASEAAEQEADADGEAEEDEQGGGSPKGRKRARVNTEGESRPTAEDEDEDEDEHIPQIKTQPRDDDGYIPGSIVRIKLHNFVTYDDVEFRPGPYLNMILGPNGTGKSSIACAICLGLNWPPTVLGRAADVPSFVKMDADSGFIEIELKGSRGEKNVVIRRNLQRNNRLTTFTLNGRSCTGNDVKAKMEELNVQVGNLCSFLPQDKVSEFAAMSPQQLLRETQRAAGDKNLTKWHGVLIDHGKSLRGVQDKLNEEITQLNQMKERNEAIERDVKRFLERKQIEDAIALLKVVIPTRIYDEMRTIYANLKAQQRKQHKLVSRLKDKNAPAHAKLGELKAKYEALDQQRGKQKKAIIELFDKLSRLSVESDKLYENAEDLNREMDEVEKDEKNRISRIRNLESEITKIEEQLREEVKTEDPKVIEGERRALNERSRAHKEAMDKLQDKMGELGQQKFHALNRMRGSQNELQGLAQYENMQLVRLRQADRDAGEAVVWLRQHRDKFQMEVIEPAYISVSVVKEHNGRPTPPAIADAIEACVTGFMPRTFVAQCQEDADTLNHWVNDTDQALGRKAQIAVWFKPNDQLAPPPVPREQLSALGFDGYALDFVKCPDAMRWYLSANASMHAIPISLSEQRANVNGMTDIVGGRGGGSFIVEHTRHSVTKSRYGRRAVTSSTYSFSRAVIFAVDAQVDEGHKSRLMSDVQEAQREIALLDEQISSLEAEIAEGNEKAQSINNESDAIKKRFNAIQQAKNRRGQLQSQLEIKRTRLHKAKNERSVEDKRADLKRKMLQLGTRRIKLTKEIIDLARTIRDEQTKNTNTGLKHLQIAANKDYLERLCKEKDEKYNKALAEFSEIDKKFKNHKSETKSALDASREALADCEPEIRTRYEEIQQKRAAYKAAVEQAKQENRDESKPPEDVDMRTAEDLQVELDNEEAKLELNTVNNPGVVEQYESRKRAIEQLEKTIEKEQREAAGLEKKIKRAQDNWKPALERLVSSIGKKFSATFDRIGCAGEVRIREDPDYDKWAIDILVKFRDSEKLQLLTAQRQSGGERSLTTILYLMSLTEEARAPFSLVDEINQGMDQRAERMVHNSMVEVTCKPESAQYFLITPKLLPDLKYHERMKILCVNNGEWLPDNTADGGNMNDMITRFLRTRARNPNAA
ncbi:hypothetical protein HDZ31DRAFT_28723 [Schizophyllum fasciatum]